MLEGVDFVSKKILAVLLYLAMGVIIGLIIFIVIFVNKPKFNILESVEWHDMFVGYTPEYEKDTTKVISKKELARSIENYLDGFVKITNKNSEYEDRYEFDQNIFVYHDKQKGLFIVNLGMYHISKETNVGHYTREQIFVNACNGEVITKVFPMLQTYDGVPLYVQFD